MCHQILSQCVMDLMKMATSAGSVREDKISKEGWPNCSHTNNQDTDVH